MGQESWGYVVAKLLRGLPIEVPAELVERGTSSRRVSAIGYAGPAPALSPSFHRS
ncbi:MAG TPA: hypothetical protein VFF07_08205 [Actinomycetota bacterium]|nr:hypothetical protein [Actinomycetota bacterium]